MNDWSMLKKLIWLHIVKGGGGIERTVKGAIVHVINALAMPAKALTVNVEPIQDLHGYDSPWPAGGGKNKCPLDKLDAVGWAYNCRFYPDRGGQILSTLNSLPVGTYTLSFSEKVISVDDVFTSTTAAAVTGRVFLFSNGAMFARNDGINITRQQALNGYSSTRSLTFEITAATVGTFTDLYFYGLGRDAATEGAPNGKLGTADIWNIQLEAGSSATSFASYSNICPISGRTSATVTRTGKNLNPYEGVNYTADTHPNGIFLKAGTYIFSLDTGVAFGYNHAMYIKLKDENGNVITKGNISGDEWQLNSSETYYYGGGDSNMPKPFNLLKDCYVCFGFNNQYPAGGNAVQLELGSTATDYEPYAGNSYTIQLGDTVYGGMLDVTGGKMVVDMAMVDLGTLNWNKDDNRIGNYYTSNITATPAPKMIGFAVACSQYAVNNLANANTIQNGEISSFNSYGQPRVFIKDIAKADLTGEQFTTAMSGVQLVYELATPIEITLTPTQIDMLLGENNLWADAGDLTLTYYADGNASTSEALGILLGGTYNNPGGADDVSDDEALEILLGGS